MRQPRFCLFWLNSEYPELCNPHDEYQEQACDSDVREGSDYLWVDEGKGFAEARKLVFKVADWESD